LTIKSEILTELRNGTPLMEINRRFRSKSLLYEAMREYSVEAEKAINEVRERIMEAKREASELQTELKRLNSEKQETSMEANALQLTKEKLGADSANLSKELAQLNADASDLKAKGFTSEIMNEIQAIERRSGPELLLQVETAEKYKQVGEEVACLEKKKGELEELARVLETEKRKTDQRVVSARNRLDQLELRTATFKRACTVVCSLFKDGYSTEDITSLKQGLDAFGIRGDSGQSISRLVEGLKKQKTLVALRSRVTELDRKLDSQKKALAETEGKSKAVKEVTLNAIEQAKNAALKAIANTEEQTNKATQNTTTRL
jgi:chromosome segregation ATPase